MNWGHWDFQKEALEKSPQNPLCNVIMTGKEHQRHQQADTGENFQIRGSEQGLNGTASRRPPPAPSSTAGGLEHPQDWLGACQEKMAQTQIGISYMCVALIFLY